MWQQRIQFDLLEHLSLTAVVFGPHFTFPVLPRLLSLSIIDYNGPSSDYARVIGGLSCPALTDVHLGFWPHHPWPSTHCPGKLDFPLLRNFSGSQLYAPMISGESLQEVVLWGDKEDTHHLDLPQLNALSPNLRGVHLRAFPLAKPILGDIDILANLQVLILGLAIPPVGNMTRDVSAALNRTIFLTNFW